MAKRKTILFVLGTLLGGTFSGEAKALSRHDEPQASTPHVISRPQGIIIEATADPYIRETFAIEQNLRIITQRDKLSPVEEAAAESIVKLLCTANVALGKHSSPLPTYSPKKPSWEIKLLSGDPEGLPQKNPLLKRALSLREIGAKVKTSLRRAKSLFTPTSPMPSLPINLSEESFNVYGAHLDSSSIPEFLDVQSNCSSSQSHGSCLSLTDSAIGSDGGDNISLDSKTSQDSGFSTFRPTAASKAKDQAFLCMAADITPRTKRSHAETIAALQQINEGTQKMGEIIDRLSQGSPSSFEAQFPIMQLAGSPLSPLIPGPIALKRLSQEAPKIAEPITAPSTRGNPPPVAGKPLWLKAGHKAHTRRKNPQRIGGTATSVNEDVQASAPARKPVILPGRPTAL